MPPPWRHHGNIVDLLMNSQPPKLFKFSCASGTLSLFDTCLVIKDFREKAASCLSLHKLVHNSSGFCWEQPWLFKHLKMAQKLLANRINSIVWYTFVNYVPVERIQFRKCSRVCLQKGFWWQRNVRPSPGETGEKAVPKSERWKWDKKKYLLSYMHDWTRSSPFTFLFCLLQAFFLM